MAPDVPPVTISPVIHALLAETNNRELVVISSARTVEVAPDVEPVITSFFAKEPPNVFSSLTIVPPASSPFLFVWFNNTKLSVVPSVSKRIWSIAVSVSRFNSADSMKRK